MRKRWPIVLVLCGTVIGSCGSTEEFKASESLDIAITRAVHPDESRPMLCVDSVAIHVRDKGWSPAKSVWSTTKHEHIVALIDAIRTPFDDSERDTSYFMVQRREVRISFICRRQGIYAWVYLSLPVDSTAQWNIQDGYRSAIWSDGGRLRTLAKNLGIERALFDSGATGKH